MADYKKMYTTLFQDVTAAIGILQNAQRKTEELFIGANDAPIRLFDPVADTSDDADGEGD